MKKILSITLILALVLGLCSCSSANTPENAVTNFMKAMKNADKEKADKYGDYNKMVEQLVLPGIDLPASTKTELVKATFNEASVKIVSTSQKDSKATVIVKINTLDMNAIFKTSLQEIYSYFYSNYTKGSSASDMQKKNYEIYLKNIKNKNSKTIQSQISIPVKKIKDQWKIDFNTDTLNALSGNLGTNKESILQDVIANFSVSGIDPNTGEQTQR